MTEPRAHGGFLYQWEQRGSHHLVFDQEGRTILQVDEVKLCGDTMVYGYAYGAPLGSFRDVESAKSACMAKATKKNNRWWSK
jgi:hypothetical protein